MTTIAFISRKKILNWKIEHAKLKPEQMPVLTGYYEETMDSVYPVQIDEIFLRDQLFVQNGVQRLDASKACWFYRDDEKKLQGPFAATQLKNWKTKMNPMRLIKYEVEGVWLTASFLFKVLNRELPPPSSYQYGSKSYVQKPRATPSQHPLKSALSTATCPNPKPLSDFNSTPKMICTSTPTPNSTPSMICTSTPTHNSTPTPTPATVPLYDDTHAPMDWEEVVKTVQELRESGMLVTVEDMEIDEFSEIEEIEMIDIETVAIYAVIDTNVLISNVKVLQQLISSSRKEGACRNVLFIIPWIVLCELDGLKKRENDVGVEARAALHLLKDNIKSDVVKLQSMQDFKKTLNKSYDSNDDKILQTCLYYTDRLKTQTRLVLLTNDVNLLLKSHASNVPALQFTPQSQMNTFSFYEYLKKEIEQTDKGNEQIHDPLSNDVQQQHDNENTSTWASEQGQDYNSDQWNSGNGCGRIQNKLRLRNNIENSKIVGSVSNNVLPARIDLHIESQKSKNDRDKSYLQKGSSTYSQATPKCQNSYHFDSKQPDFQSDQQQPKLEGQDIEMQDRQIENLSQDIDSKRLCIPERKQVVQSQPSNNNNTIKHFNKGGDTWDVEMTDSDEQHNQGSVDCGGRSVYQNSATNKNAQVFNNRDINNKWIGGNDVSQKTKEPESLDVEMRDHSQICQGQNTTSLDSVEKSYNQDSGKQILVAPQYNKSHLLQNTRTHISEQIQFLKADIRITQEEQNSLRKIVTKYNISAEDFQALLKWKHQKF